MGDLIDRQAAIDALDFDAELLRRALDDADVVGAERAKYEWGLWVIESCISDVKELPSTQPESRREWYMKGYRDAQDAALHESCTDCPLYDHDRHRCPRFNKVIPTTIQEILDTQTQRWVPVTERLPVEGDSVLLCNSYGDITLGRLVRTNEGCNWDIYAWWCDIDDWNAWMSLPEPWKGDAK